MVLLPVAALLLVLATVRTGTGTGSVAGKRVLLANGVEMPFVNLGGVSSSPSNYSAYLQLGGRGLDTALTVCHSHTVTIDGRCTLDACVRVVSN